MKGAAPIRLGIDIVAVGRIRRLARERAFLDRVFTDVEMERAGTAADRAVCLSRAFAVKEACMKALGTGWADGVGWKEIETTADGPAATCAQLHGRAKELAGGAEPLVSAANTDELAAAMAVLVGRRPQRGAP